MIAGLPVGTWALAALAVVPGIAVAVAACRIHGRGDARMGQPGRDGGQSAQASGGGGGRGG